MPCLKILFLLLRFLFILLIPACNKGSEDIVLPHLTLCKPDRFYLHNSKHMQSKHVLFRYRLTLEAWEITDEQSKGSASYQFTVSTIPYGGNFTVEPAHGESLATLFHFDCANWYDVHRPITYEFLASLGNGLYSILAFGYKSSVEITLPPGDPGSNHTLNVTALISNYQGVFTQEEIFVQVRSVSDIHPAH